MTLKKLRHSLKALKVSEAFNGSKSQSLTIQLQIDIPLRNGGETIRNILNILVLMALKERSKKSISA